MVTSGVMWIFELFSVEFCLLAVTFIVAVFFGIVYCTCPEKGIGFFAIKEIKFDHSTLFGIAAILFATILSVGAYSTMGIGYNDGNAQIRALSILNGNNTHTFVVGEYDSIVPDSRYAQYFYDSIYNLDRENFTADYWFSADASKDGDNRMFGDYGCNPVYPSVLALSAKIFGVRRMPFIQAIFAFCVFVFIDEMLLALKCDWKLKSILVTLLGVSPIVIYCNHTALVEPVIGFCMVMFMYALICKSEDKQALSILAATAFSFLHTAVYTVIPLFLVLYWLYYIHTKKKVYVISGWITVLGYILGFIYMNIVAYENTLINYRIGIPFFGNGIFVFVIILTVIAVVVGAVLIVAMNDIDDEKLREFEEGRGQKIFKIMVTVLSAAAIVLVIVFNIGSISSYEDVTKLTLVAFTACSGVILLPLTLGRLISTSYKTGVKEAAVIVAFLYTILLYSTVMKGSLDGYYYDARYIVSYLPFVILAAGLMLSNFKEEIRYFIPVIGIVIMMIPYSASLLSKDAENRMDNNMFFDIIETVEKEADEDTVVFIEKNLMKYFYYPLVDLTDARIYPMEASEVPVFCKDTRDTSSRVLYITNKSYLFKAKGTVRYFHDFVTKTVSQKDMSLALGLPNDFHEKDNGIVEVIKIGSLSEMLSRFQYSTFDYTNVELAVKDVEIDENRIAHVTVSVTDSKNILYNDVFYLSYHLDYQKSPDTYDLPRTMIGPFVAEYYTIDLDLSELDERLTVVIDMLEEGVEWYSWENDVPAVTFSVNEEDNKLEYKIEKIMGDVK